MAEKLTTTTDELARAVWSTASANDLPDSAFAYIEPGGEKDEEGKTKPRTLRHLPYKNADGKVDPAHVRDALARLPQTQIPESAKASAYKKLIAAAKSVGIEVNEDDKDDAQERSMTKKTEEALARAAANHEPFTGTHSHSHPAFGSQGGDETHEHEHTHDGDADHSHSHSEERAQGANTAITPESLAVYMPITRYDATSREVFGQATVEQPDSYGTIFGYYPEAWTSWRGNMREQHDPKKAVGKAFKVEPDEQQRAIYVTSKVSRGAQDTWLKIEDGVLSGYSASVIPDPEFGSDPKRWPRKEYQGKQYPYLPRYTVAELSYVDNPATPGCNISLVRADGFLTEVIDASEEEEVSEPEQKPIERAGARVSSDTRDAMHKSIGHTLHAAASQMENCGCDACQAAMKMLDPDGDGDIDLGGYDDPDGDAASLYGDNDADTERALSGLVERILEQKLSAVYARLQGIAGALARSNVAPAPLPIESILTSAITRAVEAVNAAHESSLSEVRADLSAVKETVGKIADTPVPGAPVLNAGAIPRPVEKRLATDSYAMPRSGGAVYDAVAALSAAGQLDTVEKQVDAVAVAMAAQRRR